MLEATVVLGALGATLLIGARVVAGCCGRWVIRGMREPGGLARLVGAALLLIALLFRLYNPRTAAFPPPPDAAGWESSRM